MGEEDPADATGATTARVFPGDGPMATRARAHAWEATALGPVAGWPAELRTTVALTLRTPFPMAIVAGPERVLIYNDGFAAVLGATKAPVALGRPVAEVWPELSPMLDGREGRELGTWAEDQLFVLDRQLPREEVYLTLSCSPIVGPEGRAIGVLCTCYEVTARVVGERRLRLLRDLGARLAGAHTVAEVGLEATRALGEARSDVPYALLYLVDADREVARLLGATGLPAGDPRVVAEFRIGERRNAPVFRRALASGRPEVLTGVRQIAGELPGGTWPESPEAAIVAPIAVGGEAAGLLFAGLSPRRVIDDDYLGFVDLAAARIGQALAAARAYEGERRRAEGLEALDQAKNAFFGNVSHELRTPLALMLGPLADLRASPRLDEPGRHLVEVALQAGKRLTRLVNKLLDVVRVEAGKTDTTFEPTDLATATADLASMFRTAIEGAGLTLRVDASPLPEPVWVDREMYEKVVLNLLSNALKHTAAGEIAVTVDAVGERARLVVRDTGCGIAQADLPLVFERFFRARAGWSRTLEGSGIGLALVRELVRLHGGAIEVASELGVGTTFTVTLPLGDRHVPEARRAAAPRMRPTAFSAEPFVDEAMSWLPAAQVGGAGAAVPASEVVAERGAHAGSARRAGQPTARILVVDDNAEMRGYLARLLSGRWEVDVAADAAEAAHSVSERPVDLVLCDVMLPDVDGFELLARLRADPRTADLPVILLSARAGEEAKVEGFESGADGYLVKPFSSRELVARVAGALALARLRREAAARQRAADERFRSLMAATHDVIWEQDVASDRLDWNDELERQTGWRRADVPTRAAWSARIHPDEVAHVSAGLAHALASGEATWSEQYRARTRGGTYRWFLDRAMIVRGEDGAPARLIGALFDVTERERLADEVRRAERLQAAGKLAGGMAHEVNNMMTAVLGFGDFVLRRLPDPAATERAAFDPSIRSDIEHMVRAGERAARVTKQLLAFTRRQVLQPTVLEVGAVVRELAPALARVAGATIHIALELAPGVGSVRVDRTQLEQVLVNLVHNARDAMDHGGTITIATSQVEFAPPVMSGGEAPTDGPHVVLTVRDTGIGMDPATLRQAFEPFFTTKPIGQGTGLGLSTVYGTVHQSGGHITLESALGLGTTATIYLPVVAPGQAAADEAATSRLAGDEVVLVVEDELIVRTIVTRTLAECGFRVVSAIDGVDALSVLAAKDGAFDLVLTDVVMPRMAGRELSEAIRDRYPALPVVFMSGYTGEEVVRRGLLEPDAPFLQKPFTPKALLECLREVLDGRPR